MSDSQKLTQLDPATSVAPATDLLYLVQDGVSLNVTPQTLFAALSVLAQNLNAQGRTISDFLLRGALDAPYSLSSDPANVMDAGVIQLVDDYNVYHHGNLTSAVELRFPATPPAGAAPFGVVTIYIGAGGAVTLAGNDSWVWEKAKATDDDPTISQTVGSVIRFRYQYEHGIAKYSVAYSELDT